MLGKLVKGGVKVAGKHVEKVQDLTGEREIEVHSRKDTSLKKPVNIVGGKRPKEGGPTILDKHKGV